MAKKQTIILTHGSTIPSASGITKGEVLVQHASNKTDSALHTVTDDNELVSFPSKEWVNAEIANLNIGNVNSQISGLQTALNNMDAAYKQADKDLETAYKAADAAIATAFGQADADLKTELEGKITKVENDYKAADQTITGNVNAAVNRIKTLEDNYAALDDTYATNNELAGVKSELEGEIAKAKTTLTEATAVTEGVKVVKDTTDPNKYTVTAVGLAKSSELSALNTRVQTIEGTGEGSVKKALEDAKSYADGIVATEKTARENADTALSNRLGTGVTSASTATAQFAAIDGKINAINTNIGNINGDDAGMSMKAVAQREVKVLQDMLYGSGSTAVIDTLKDVIDWIADDKTGAADMVADIAALQQVTSGYTTANAIKNDIQSVKDSVAGLDNTYATNDELAGVKSELEGEIAKAKTTLTEAIDVTAGVKVVKDTTDPNKYTVTAVGLAKSSELSALNTRVQTIEGTGEGSVKKALEDAKSYADGIVATEKTARENADTALSNRLGTGVTSGNTATAQFAAINAKLGTGITSSSTATAQINGLDNRIQTIEGAYIKTVTVTNTATNNITASVASNALTLNFDSMVIDGGTY